MIPEDTRVSAWNYCWAGIIFCCGLWWGGTFLFDGVRGLTKEVAFLRQVVVPGSKTITFTEAGEYTIYYEYQTVVGNKVYSTSEHLPPFESNLIYKDTGESIKIKPAVSTFRYSFGNRRGESVFEFTIDRPGRYDFSGGYRNGYNGAEIVMAIGRSFLGGVIKHVAKLLLGIAIGVASTVISVVVLILVYMRRRIRTS